MSSVAGRGAGFGTTVGDEEITVSSTAVALTVPTSEDYIVKGALITNGAQPIRFRTSGLDPTADVGHYVAANTAFEVFGKDMANLRMIKDDATDSVVFVSYLRD